MGGGWEERWWTEVEARETMQMQRIDLSSAGRQMEAAADDCCGCRMAWRSRWVLKPKFSVCYRRQSKILPVLDQLSRFQVFVDKRNNLTKLVSCRRFAGSFAMDPATVLRPPSERTQRSSGFHRDGSIQQSSPVPPSRNRY